MDAPTFQRELAKFRPEVPIEEAWTPPKSWYTSRSFLERERDTVFARSWQYACPADLVAEPGCFARVDLLDESYVVLRGDDGVLRGFHNVCRHHAAQLVEGEGCVRELVCPYHGWTYALDGSLKSAPRLGGIRGFERERFGLPAVAVEAWGPFVFLHAGRPARPVSTELAELGGLLDAFGMDGLKHVRRRHYLMKCNWKVFVDNYLDGGYHIAHLHHGLASQLDLDDYGTRLYGRFNVQSCPGAAEATFRGRDFRERIGRGAVYAWIYPNLMVNRYGPILDTNWVVPLDEHRCDVVFDYWFAVPETKGTKGTKGAEDAERFVAQSLEASDDVQQEDVWISEVVQRGIRSSSYDQGRYAPKLEVGMHQFHRMLAADLRAAPESGDGDGNGRR